MGHSTTVAKKPRESGIELYRIITMLVIVAHHYVLNSGVFSLADGDGFTARALFYFVFGMWGKTGINCFVMITGYFMCTSSITWRKFLKLVLEVIFYNVAITAIFVVTGHAECSWRTFLCFWPVMSVSTGFVSCYILFFLFIPFLNILVGHMTRREHLLLVALLLFIYTFMGTIPLFTVTMNYVSWFCTLYFIASYIRLHGDETPWLSRCHWTAWALLSVVVSAASVVALVWVRVNVRPGIYPYLLVSDSNAPLALLTGVCAFMMFKNLNIGYSRVINQVAMTMFGVLLIHANSSVMRQWLWHDLLDVTGHFHSSLYWLYSIMAVVAVFGVCVLIDWVRIRIIEKPLFRYIDRWLAHS